MKNKAVFLDRDGVINNNSNHYYIYNPGNIRLNKGVTEAIKKLRDTGFIIIVITNQGGIAKGIYEPADVEKIHRYIATQIEQSGGKITDFFYCPHHKSLENCLCSKPGNLLIEKAMAQYNIDPSKSWLIGDSERDIEAGERSGIQSVKVESNSNLLDTVHKHLNL